MKLKLASRKPPSAVRQRRGLLRICVIVALTPLLFVLELRPDRVRSVHFSPDGRCLLSEHEGRADQYWEVASGRRISNKEELARLPPGDEFRREWPGRDLQASLADNTVRLWDPTGRQPSRLLSGHTRAVKCTAFSPDSRLLASGGADGTVRMWSVETGRELWRAGAYPTRIDTRPWMDKPMANFGQVVLFSLVMMAWFIAVWVGLSALAAGLTRGRVKAVQVSPDGRTLAVAGVSDLRLLETSTGCELWSRLVYEGARRVVFLELARLPGAPILADTRAFGIVLRSRESGGVLRRVRGRGLSAGLTGAITPDGRLAAFGGVRTVKRQGVDQQLGALELVETESRHEHILDGHEKPVSALAFRPNGSLLASGSADRTIRLWETATAAEQARLSGHGGAVTCLAFSPDGSLLVSGSEDKTVRLWDVQRARERLRLVGHAGPVTSVAFSPDGRCVASCSADTTIRLCEVSAGRELFCLEGHSAKVNALAFSPDGAFLVSGGDDKTVRAWDPSTGAQLWRLTAKRVGNYGVRFERA